MNPSDQWQCRPFGSSRHSLNARPAVLMVLAFVLFPAAAQGSGAEQSFTGKVVEVACAEIGIIVKIRVTSRAGLTEQQATAQRRPAVEEVRLDVSCPAQESSVKRFIRKQTLRKVLTVRFSNVDRGNRPMADVFLPGGRSLIALVQTRFPPRR